MELLTILVMVISINLFLQPIFHGLMLKAAAEASTYLGRAGYLVTITNQLEQDFAFNNINLSGWIGLSQPNNLAEPGGNWQWVDGTSLSYSNWGSWRAK